MAILYRGSGPHFFAESVPSFVSNEPIDSFKLNEISDPDIRVKLSKVYIIILLLWPW